MRFIPIKSALLAALLILAFTAPAPAAQNEDFATWLQALRREAIDKKGISPELVNAALTNVQLIPRVVELDRKQPESTMNFETYKKKVISQDRINKGRALYIQHRELLNRIGRQYGVAPQYIVALWGIETSYGDNTGGFDVIPALVTLSYDGRRSGYFRGELMNALRILEQGHINLANMKGSWAGAMGQNQFMPSSFIAYASDGDDDGRRDIWNSLPDVFASTANYLAMSGWNNEYKWGREVWVPERMEEKEFGLDNSKFVSEWKAIGVTLPGGGALPTTEKTRAAIVMPDGKKGPAFLVYDNYRVIMKWNKSTYFATSVGLLADKIAQ